MVTKMPASIESAKNPDLRNTVSVVRSLNKKELMLRAKAICTQQGSPSSASCSGQISIGLFFDGTGNNEKEDYLNFINSPARQKHSNVVRLYHAYPTVNPSPTNQYYATYIPGVGTPFDDIGDSGGALGTGFSWNGEDRIIWGLLSVLNSMSQYISDNWLIPPKQAGEASNELGGFSSSAKKRRSDLRYWVNTLKSNIAGRSPRKPMPEQVNISVFGFSRGAAEARAFVNWFFEICEKDGEVYSIAGVPVRVAFLGIFDTVASVGIAGGFSSGMLESEGHQSWANNNMQIHPKVESCLHIVAAHDVRATFPVDSVRIDGKYPANVTEYIYPGSHSDVGGGYAPGAQGKSDEIARIAGHEMYCAALAAGVPFKKLDDLPVKVKTALLPTQKGLDAFNAYYEKANIKAGPVEDMMRQHMAHYFTYRYQARKAPGTHPIAGDYYNRRFFKAAHERGFLQLSQLRFIAILACVVEMIDHIMETKSEYDSVLPQPFQVLITGSTGIEKLTKNLPQRYSLIFKKRLMKSFAVLDTGADDKIANKIPEKLQQWRSWLEDNASPLLQDAEAPERDILSVVQTLTDVPQPKEIVDFFDHWVHDSMAGLHSDKVDEFLLNGIGLAKFRRVYFGNRADAMTREATKATNESKLASAKSQRARLKQWRLESTEFARTRS